MVLNELFMQCDDSEYSGWIGADVPLVWPGQLVRIKRLVCLDNQQTLTGSLLSDLVEELFHVLPALRVKQVGWRAENNPGIFSSSYFVTCHPMRYPKERVRSDHFDLIRQLQGGHIFFNQLSCGKVLFQQDGLVGTSAQCFQADGTGSREEVKNETIFDCRSNEIESGFTYSIFHGPSSRVTTVLNRLSPQSTADNANPT